MDEKTAHIREADPRAPGASAVLTRHWEYATRNSPMGSGHALDLDALSTEDVTFWTIEVGGEVVGCGALREIDPAHGEIKSMHVVEESRGRGLAAMLVEHMIEIARERGYTRLSLETGSNEAFEAARKLYERFGFERCEAFGEYADDPFSLCMTRGLD